MVKDHEQQIIIGHLKNPATTKDSHLDICKCTSLPFIKNHCYLQNHTRLRHVKRVCILIRAHVTPLHLKNQYQVR